MFLYPIESRESSRTFRFASLIPLHYFLTPSCQNANIYNTDQQKNYFFNFESTFLKKFPAEKGNKVIFSV